MEHIRAAVGYYGKDSTEWAPYRPLHAHPLVSQAQAIAAARLFGSDVTDLKHLQHTLEAAKEANDLVVLLLDPWSTRIPDSRRQLSDNDRGGLPNAAVLVPVSTADEESERSREELMFDVEQTLVRFLGRPDALYSGRLPTPESFEGQLAETLEEGRNRMFRAARPRSTARSSAGDRPILRGP
jgi:FxsC-like protein